MFMLITDAQLMFYVVICISLLGLLTCLYSVRCRTHPFKLTTFLGNDKGKGKAYSYTCVSFMNYKENPVLWNLLMLVIHE